MDEQRKAEQQHLNTEDGAAVTGGDFASAGGQLVFGGAAYDQRDDEQSGQGEGDVIGARGAAGAGNKWTDRSVRRTAKMMLITTTNGKVLVRRIGIDILKDLCYSL